MSVGLKCSALHFEEMARRMGLEWSYPGEAHGVAAVYEEMRQCMLAAIAGMNGADLQELGLAAGEVITVQSRRGEVVLHLRRDDRAPPGAVFIPFAYYEAAANLLTNAALDPMATIPEFKYCAVRIRRGGQLAAAQEFWAPLRAMRGVDEELP